MSWKTTIKLVVSIQIVVLLALSFFLSRGQIKTQSLALGPITGIFPAGHYSPIATEGWEGFQFQHRFRMLIKRYDSTPEAITELVKKNQAGAVLTEKISLFEEAYYIVKRRPKGYILIAIIREGEHLVWMDIVSNSTLSFSQDFFHVALLSLAWEKKQPQTEKIQSELEAVRKQISPFMIHSLPALMVFIAGLFVLTMAVIYIIMRFSGQCPAESDGFTQLSQTGATLVTRKMGSQSSPCCLRKEGEFLVVYRFRREVLRIDLSREKDDIEIDNYRIRYKQYQIIMEPENFQNWRPYLPI